MSERRRRQCAQEKKSSSPIHTGELMNFEHEALPWSKRKYARNGPPKSYKAKKSQRLRGHPERTSQVRGEGGSAQRGQSKATFKVTLTS